MTTVYKRVYKGVREIHQKKGVRYAIVIDLPPRTLREHSHSFHIGTVGDLEVAISIRKKAEEVKKKYKKDSENLYKHLELLREDVKGDYPSTKRKRAILTINNMLENGSKCKAEKEALELALKALSKNN